MLFFYAKVVIKQQKNQVKTLFNILFKNSPSSRCQDNHICFNIMLDLMYASKLTFLTFILDENQYRKYLRVLNITFYNKGIII